MLLRNILKWWKFVGFFLFAFQFLFILLWHSKQFVHERNIEYETFHLPLIPKPHKDTARMKTKDDSNLQWKFVKNRTLSPDNSQLQTGTKREQEADGQNYHLSMNASGLFTGNGYDKPYLVYCIKIEECLLPIAKYFRQTRLIDGFGEIPPWNATVLLLVDDNFCADHPYMKESINRRRESPFIDTSNHVKELNGQWKLGVYWPNVARKKFMRVVRDRPVLMSIRGEVFWRNSENPCKDVDFVWDRHIENPSDECITIHYLQGVSGAYLREFPVLEEGELGSRATTDIYEGRVMHPNRPSENDMRYDKFCSFLIRSDPNGLVEMFKNKFYDIDAIFRHMFFKQLGEYKPCERINGCPGNPYTSYKCFVGKFHITMENSAVDGYISEKLFNGALGTGIPIYFGASDVGSHINAKSVVHCNVSRMVIEEMRAFYPRAPKKSRAFLFNRTSFWPTEQELLKWADGYLRPHLEPCIKKVIELDSNDTAFREVLNEPFITNQDIMSGLYPLRGIELAYSALRNWASISSSDENVRTGIRDSLPDSSFSPFRVIELWTYPVQPIGVTPNSRHTYICSYNTCRTTMFEKGIVPQSLSLKSLVSSSNVPLSYQNFVGDQHWFKVLHQFEFPHHVQLVSIMLLLLQHERKGGSTSSKKDSREIPEPPLCVMTVGLESSKICSDSSQFKSLKKKYDPTVSMDKDLVYKFIPLNLTFPERFGILGFDNRVSTAGEATSGDELQTFAGLQFLPYLSDIVDRETGLPFADQVNLFGNGWWGTTVGFPPNQSANLILFSMQMSGIFLQVASDNLEYFESYAQNVGPIGARDISSFQFLKEKGVPVFVSSCFTQMISMYREEKNNNLGIVIVDVEPEHLPETILDVAKKYSANFPENNVLSRFERLKHAYSLLRIYATETKVLITSRIHAALPASALGIPVIFVEKKSLPGGGGGGRTGGLSDLFHTYNTDSINASWPFGNLNDIGSNPQVHRQDRYRASFWHYIKTIADRKHHYYEDTARLFGMVPLSRLGKGTGSRHLHSLFHFIFTTSSKTLTLRVQRAIEAVFYHHPNAKVMLHSNTLSNGTILDCLWEAGYDFGIYNYSFLNLLQGSSATKTSEVNEIAKLLPYLQKEMYWYSHETDFIRLLLLERYGGVYLDTDMHVIRPFNSTIKNLVAWQDSNHRLINGAAMVFEKGNKYLQSCLRRGVSTLLAGYEPQLWSTYGPNLLTSTYRDWFKMYQTNVTAIVDVAENDVFYPYPYEIVHECFQCDKASESPIDISRTLAVHLNTKVTAGNSVEQNSVCSRILTESCIFCGDSIIFSKCSFHTEKQAIKVIQTSHWTKMNRYPDEYMAVQKFLKNTSPPAKAKILSFGSSTGEEAISLATLYFNEKEGFPDVTIYGFDVDNPTIYKARQKIAKHHQNLPIHFFNVQETPLNVHGKYDAIFANSVLCHDDPDAGPIAVETIESRFTLQDFEASLLKLDAVLNDGGLLAMVNTNYYFVDTILAERYEALAQCYGDFVPRIDITKHVLEENNEMRRKDCVWRKRKSQ